jgi:hypothetical protein
LRFNTPFTASSESENSYKVEVIAKPEVLQVAQVAERNFEM